MDQDVVIVGGGVAGLTCGIYTARAGLATIVVDAGPSILERNAMLENYPGFPGGVDARRFLAGAREQAADAGCSFVDGRVAGVTRDGSGFAATTAEETVRAERVVAASWSDASYLDELDVETVDRGTKTFLEVDGGGRTSVDGVYAAGRLAGKPHQAVIAAGHGGEVGLAVVHDSDVPLYHDWVTPEGYFTDRGRELPPGCEEIGDAERREREADARGRLRELLEGAADPPLTHPSLEEPDE